MGRKESDTIEQLNWTENGLQPGSEEADSSVLCAQEKEISTAGQCKQYEVGSQAERLGVYQAYFLLFLESQTTFPSSLCSSVWPRDWVPANGRRAGPATSILLGLPHKIFPLLALPVAWCRWAGRLQKHQWRTPKEPESLHHFSSFPHHEIPTPLFYNWK